MSRFWYQEFKNDGRFQTPASFPRTIESDSHDRKPDGEKITGYSAICIQRNEQAEDKPRYPTNMSNPFIERGYTMPYEISQNRYREQVFGSMPTYNYPQQPKPEPLAGRNLPPRNYRPTSYSEQFTSPRNYYEPPRDHHHYERRHQPHIEAPQQYEQRTYRSGRPDLGFENYQATSVPYPQEPIRHRSNYYEPPPEIGYGIKYGPSASQDPVKIAQILGEDVTGNPDSLEDDTGAHPGWLLLLRFHKDGEVNVRRALTMAAKHIESDGGRILGLAKSYSTMDCTIDSDEAGFVWDISVLNRQTEPVRIREGGESWVTFGGLRYFGGGNWDIQQNPTQDDTHYDVLAIFFSSLSRAIQWFDRDSCFKQKDFPPPYTTDCIALPLNSSVDTKYCKTLVLTEYTRITDPEYFRERFSVPTQEMMSQRFRASPYVVKASSVPVEDPRLRTARHLRGSWIKRNSIITLSMFESLQEAHRYFTDAEYMKCKGCQDRVSAPTTVVIDLENWRM